MNVPDAACVKVETDELHEVGTVLVPQRVYVEKLFVIAALKGVHRVRDLARFCVVYLFVRSVASGKKGEYGTMMMVVGVMMMLMIMMAVMMSIMMTMVMMMMMMCSLCQAKKGNHYDILYVGFAGFGVGYLLVGSVASGKEGGIDVVSYACIGTA